MSTFLLRRPIDWSLLTNGFHIPTEIHPLVYALPGDELQHGDKRGVKMMIDEMSELDLKTFTPCFDPNAGIKKRTAIQLILQLDRSIGS